MGRIVSTLRCLIVLLAFGPSLSFGQGIADTLRRDIFVEHYLEAARQNPQVLVSNLAYIIDVTRPAGASPASEYARIIESQSINESIGRFRPYLPQVGIGVQVGPSLGLISGGVGLSYDVTPLLVNLVRMSLGAQSPDEVNARLKDISNLDADAIRGVGRLVYDSYQQADGPLAKFHPLYQIATIGAPSLPAPGSSPQAYLDRSNPMVRAWITAKLHGTTPENRQALLSDWGKFAVFLKDNPDRALAPRQLDALAERVASKLATNLQSGADSTTALREAMASALGGVPLDKDLLEVMRKMLIQERRLQVAPLQDIQVLEQDFRYAQTLLGSAGRIAAAIGSVQEQRAIAFLAAITEFVFQSSIAYSAGATALGLSSGLGAVAALATIASMFNDRGPDPSAQAITAILKNQRLIVERLAGIESQLVYLRLAVREMDATMARHADRTAFRLDELQRHIEETRAVMFFARDSVLASLKSLASDSSVLAAANLRKMAQDVEVRTALSRNDFATKQELRKHFTDLETFLHFTVTQAPFVSGVTLDDAVGQNLLQGPWSYYLSAEKFLVDSADYYRFDAARFRSRLRADEQALLDNGLAAVERLRRSPAWSPSDSHAFLRGTMLLTDAVVRFDQNYTPPIDTGALCKAINDSDSQQSHLIHALPVMDFAFREDSRDALKQWRQFFAQAVASSFVHTDYGLVDDSWVRRYLLDTNARELRRTYECQKDASRCDDHRWTGWPGAPNFLVALGLARTGIKYVKKGNTHRRIVNYSDPPSEACFDVVQVYEWTDFTVANYASKVAQSPDGVILGYRNVCRSFPSRFESREEIENVFSNRIDLPQWIWDRAFRDSIATLYTSGTDISKQADVVQRLAVNEQVIGEVLAVEQDRIRTHLKGYLSRDTDARRKMLEAQRFLSRHAVARHAALFAMTPRCRDAAWKSHLDRLLRERLSGEMVTIFEEFRRLLEEERYTEADRLVARAAEADAVVDTQQCFLAPTVVSRASGLLKLIDAHAKRPTACP